MFQIKLRDKLFFLVMDLKIFSPRFSRIYCSCFLLKMMPTKMCGTWEELVDSISWISYREKRRNWNTMNQPIYFFSYIFYDKWNHKMCGPIFFQNGMEPWLGGPSWRPKHHVMNSKMSHLIGWYWSIGWIFNLIGPSSSRLRWLDFVLGSACASQVSVRHDNCFVFYHYVERNLVINHIFFFFLWLLSNVTLMISWMVVFLLRYFFEVFNPMSCIWILIKLKLFFVLGLQQASWDCISPYD